MSQFEDFLANYDDDFANAKVQDFAELPDGKYLGRIDRMYLDPNTKSGEVALRIEFTVCAGQWDGRKIFYYKLINKKTMDFLRTDLKKLNIDPKPFRTLENYFAGMIDKVVDLQLKTGKPNAEGKTYQNTYINKLVGEAPEPADSPSANDLPF